MDVRMSTALDMKINCFCDLPAKCAIAHNFQPDAYAFLTCGGKRFKDQQGKWQSPCQFWARSDNYHTLPKCEECDRKVTSKYRKICEPCAIENKAHSKRIKT
jgi:hypothetical protein